MLRKDVRRLKFMLVVSLLIASVLLASCGGLKVRIGTRPEEPLKEFTIEGKER